MRCFKENRGRGSVKKRTLEKSLGFCFVVYRRLFQKYMFPGFERAESPFVMQTVRKRNVDTINVGAIKDVFVRR